MIMCSHFIFTFLLVFGCLSWNKFSIMINFIGGKNFIRIIGAKFKVMGFQLMQFLIVELCFFDVFPCFIEHFVSCSKSSFLPNIEAITSKRIRAFILIWIDLLDTVIFIVDWSVVLGSAPKIEMCSSLIHLLLYLLNHNVPTNKR
jgi:hypothetical protein